MNRRADLEHWRLMVLLADLGSLSKAAVVLDRPHSVVSRQLAALERECGGPLFYRTGRGVVLSELGERVMPRVRGLLHEAEELAREVQAQAGSVTGKVRIGMIASVSQIIDERLVSAMRDRLPQVTLSLSEGPNTLLGEAVSRGDVDLAILFRDRRNLSATEEALGMAPAYLVGRPDDPFLARSEVSFRELEGKPLVLSGPTGQFRQRLEQWAERLGVNLNVVVEADSLPIQRRLALSVGYGVLSRLPMAAELDARTMAAARIVDPPISFVLALCRTSARPMSTPVREAIKVIKEVIADMPGLDPIGPDATETQA